MSVCSPHVLSKCRLVARRDYACSQKKTNSRMSMLTKTTGYPLNAQYSWRCVTSHLPFSRGKSLKKIATKIRSDCSHNPAATQSISVSEKPCGRVIMPENFSFYTSRPTGKLKIQYVTNYRMSLKNLIKFLLIWLKIKITVCII